MMCRELVAAALAVAAVAAPLRADDAAGARASVDERSETLGGGIDARLAERLTRLAEHHYRNGAYYRAISAYEELALFADDDATRVRAAIRIAMSYHHGHQLDDAIPAYRTALGLARDADAAQALRIQLALARVEHGVAAPGTEALDAVAAELAPSTTTGSHRPLALFQLARIEGLAGRRHDAARTTARLREACALAALAPACRGEARLARALARPPAARRSPWLGASLSLVVPGAGSVYGGHLVDGLYSFAFTALSGLGALDVHDGQRRWTEQKVTFYGLATLATIFYTGAVVQGYVSVARHNAIAELDARTALWRETELPLPLEDLAPAR